MLVDIPKFRQSLMLFLLLWLAAPQTGLAGEAKLPDGKDPADPMTMAEFVAALIEVKEMGDLLPPNFETLDDEQKYQERVNLLTSLGGPNILAGKNPNEPVTREYAATVIYMMMKRKPDCIAILRKSGVITGPSVQVVELTSEEIVQCMENHEPPLLLPVPDGGDPTFIAAGEILDILNTPGLIEPFIPGAEEVIQPYEGSLEGVFFTPLSPVAPLP